MKRMRKIDPNFGNPNKKQQMREWYARNKDHVWKSHLERKYGLTLEQFNVLLSGQNGACAICGEIPEGRLYVDHSHKTGRIRGLLCRNCNLAIGHFKDNPEILERAVSYLTTGFH